MYKKSRLTVKDVVEFVPHLDQGEINNGFDPLIGNPHAYCVRVEGEVIFIGGFIEDSPCWSFIGGYSQYFEPIHMRYIRREFKKCFQALPCDRAHHLVCVENKSAMRLTKLLGAELECVMKKYYNGDDYAIFAMVK